MGSTVIVIATKGGIVKSSQPFPASAALHGANVKRNAFSAKIELVQQATGIDPREEETCLKKIRHGKLSSAKNTTRRKFQKNYGCTMVVYWVPSASKLSSALCSSGILMFATGWSA